MVQNILIVRTDRLGDVVLTTPTFKVLRSAYPRAKISVLLHAPTLDLVNGNPYVDEVIIDHRQRDFWRLVWQIHRRKFDLAVIFHTKRRYHSLCFLAGIPRRIGYQKNGKWSFLLSDSVKDDRWSNQKHETQYCLDLLKHVGVVAGDCDSFIPLNAQTEKWALNWMQENSLKPREFIVIHPSASSPGKCWPRENFESLINCLIGLGEFKIVLIGFPAMSGWRDEIINMTGKTSVAQMVSILKRSRLLISVDSGPVHIAAALDTPVISIFVRNDPGLGATRWKPLGQNSCTLLPSSNTVEDVLGAYRDSAVKCRRDCQK